jgi:predicted esterase
MTTALENHLIVSKTARYYTSPATIGKVKSIWFVCHGYRQLAANFINKFSSIFNDETLVVAPEGFHRFYIEGFSGKVGASWMTREDRLNDIKDYVNFLDALYKHLKQEYKLTKNCTVNLLGFSQGAATVCRWVSKGNVPTNNLILWAGVFPPDISENIEFKNLATYVLLGDQDEFTSSEIFNSQEEELKNHGIDYHFIGFKGKHDIYSEPLNYLKNQFSN